MIIQGSNSPIVISFDDDVSGVTEWSVALFGEDKRGMPSVLLKHWGTEDIEVDGSTAYAPLTEEETMEFAPGVASLEIKWLEADDIVFQSATVRVRISGRKDKTKITSAQDAPVEDNNGEE